ncbi:MAG: PilZ domain-containing protein [Candidatus Endonucleobacter sp. (ex Gigantidas childressi)]|nr:PilZ domain-containing protein [Candidatus Endonucleobacter sp. (ex Gigantidas childressi)]
MVQGMAGFLSLAIKDVVSLYEAYMPFLVRGGLFIPTSKEYKLGSEVFIRLTLMEELDVLPVPGVVVWITPKGAQGRKPEGIGIQFTEENSAVRTKIETLLAGTLGADHSTSTM